MEYRLVAINLGTVTVIFLNEMFHCLFYVESGASNIAEILFCSLLPLGHRAVLNCSGGELTWSFAPIFLD